MNALKRLVICNTANEIIGIGKPDFFMQIDLCFGLIQSFFEMLPHASFVDLAKIISEDSARSKLEL
ncbi:MAG: hypothetical protein DID89_2727547985 [Candidatus Nitrotoga sp. CP45]|nr:MAG: hypothetical protein DID89_2727547985 [Candidatus Nitrotoga sp. CP45]